MTQPRFFPLPGSPDLGRLVQYRLEKVQQEFPALRPTTLEDFQVLADKVSTIAQACQTVTKRLEAQGGRHDAATAFKQVQNELDWAEFLEEVKVDLVPIKRTLLFRAHWQTAKDQPRAYNARTLEVVFDDHYRQAKSVNDFVLSLGNHLGKTERETKIKRRLITKFTSTSSRLNWTLHLAGKKSREQHEQGEADKWKVKPDPEEYQRWARNCDEYVIMGRGVEKAVVQIVPWSELRVTPIINQHLRNAYTLKQYEQFRDSAVDRRIETGFEQVCDMIVESAQAIAGHKANDTVLVQLLVKLILKPGTWFWGINTSTGYKDIREGCKAVIENELLVKMSQVSVD
ncbi:hypothetical protein EJ07DRAFT_185780 [Lizonia empirigonia]|nr:hypothetical protein EJ07DRAFT_185780 [Lizonia empirigonia]